MPLVPCPSAGQNYFCQEQNENCPGQKAGQNLFLSEFNLGHMSKFLSIIPPIHLPFL